MPVVTPFDANEGLDLSTLTKVIDFCVDGGVRGVVSCGTTGEYYAMSSEERESVMAHTAEVVGKRAQLVAGCNAGSTREAVRLAEAAVTMGYDAIMLAAPPTSLPTPARTCCALRHGRRRRRQAGGALQLSGSRRRRDRLRLPRRSRRSSQHRRDQGIERRLLAVLASATTLRRSARHHVWQRRPGGGLLRVGCAQLACRARPTCCPGTTC